MGVSKNSGTPKSSILIGFSIINHPFWGTTIFRNIHISTIDIILLDDEFTIITVVYCTIDCTSSKLAKRTQRLVASESSFCWDQTPQLKTTIDQPSTELGWIFQTGRSSKVNLFKEPVSQTSRVKKFLFQTHALAEPKFCLFGFLAVG